jgi:hypothetical protein
MHADQFSTKAKEELIPNIVENLISGGGALTLDLTKAKQEIIAITGHAIAGKIDGNGNPFFFLESNVLELEHYKENGQG